MRKLIFNERENKIFAEMNTTADGIMALMSDLTMGKEIYDEETERVISKREASDKLRTMSLKFFGLNENSSKRDRKRAYRDYGRRYFDIIEENVDFKVTTGLRDNEWFNELVEYRNLKDGDSNQFWNDGEEVILSIAKMGKRHHDTILQRLAEGESYTVGTDLYGAAVGADIDKYLIGQVDWTKMVDAISKAFVILAQDLILEEVMNAAAKLPVQTGFVGTGTLSSATKDAFDEIIENVSIANDNAPTIIMGTQTALKKLNGLSDVEWRANSQKEDVAAMGRLGNYETTLLIEIPQRFAKNDVTKKVYDNTKLFIFASGDNKLVDMVDVGETLIDEITERGEANGRMDDIMKYEVQREIGVATKIGRYFGQWTLA